MMIHEMKLNNEPFTLIKAGTKVIEMRLNDEKRRKIKIGDKIEFTSRDSGEKIMTEVINVNVNLFCRFLVKIFVGFW